MKAIVKTKKSIKLANVNKPEISLQNDVLISVKYAGFCRTDMLLGEGSIPCSEGTVLGHEFSGIIEELGANVSKFSVDARVAVHPVISCGKCIFCKNDQKDKCQNTLMLGSDCNGGFAEYISVPQDIVYVIPDNLSFKHGAYVEPVAASLSVIKSGIKAEEKGIIYGNNRFSKLIFRILKAYNFNNVSIYDKNSDDLLRDNYYDYAIETLANEETMSTLFKAVKPGGKIVIKSRKYDLVGISFNDAIKKELNICAVNYGDFEESIKLMSNNLINVDDLFGDVYELKDFETVFNKSKSFEKRKIFFRIGK